MEAVLQARAKFQDTRENSANRRSSRSETTSLSVVHSRVIFPPRKRRRFMGFCARARARAYPAKFCYGRNRGDNSVEGESVSRTPRKRSAPLVKSATGGRGGPLKSATGKRVSWNPPREVHTVILFSSIGHRRDNTRRISETRERETREDLDHFFF